VDILHAKVLNRAATPLPFQDGVEVTTGGQRLHHREDLENALRKRGMGPHSFESLIRMFDLGMPPHGGLAIGLERLTAQVLGLQNIRCWGCRTSARQCCIHATEIESRLETVRGPSGHRRGNRYGLYEEDIKEISFPENKIRSALRKRFTNVKVIDAAQRAPSTKSDRLYFVCKR